MVRGIQGVVMETEWKGEELVECDKIAGKYEINLSFEVLKRALLLKENIRIEDIRQIPDRNRVVRIRLSCPEWEGKIATADIFPQIKLEDCQDS